MQKHLTSFHLKIIAIIAMTINHAGQIFAPQFNPPWWEFFYLTIGKITFPVMAYMLLEGLKYTKSFPKYLERLLGYAVLSIVPFHLALVQNQPIYGLNNVLFTLSIGLILIKLIESTKTPYKNSSYRVHIFNNCNAGENPSHNSYMSHLCSS